MRSQTRRARSGAQLVEFALIYAGILLPVTIMIISLAQAMWVFHTVAEMTREGARYAATHCYEPGGGNVAEYMRSNVPAVVDRDEFVAGSASISVDYYSRDEESGDLVEFECEGASCSRECIPEVVKVSITGYQFDNFLSFFGFAPIQLPNFQATSAVGSAGCSPDSEECTS